MPDYTQMYQGPGILGHFMQSMLAGRAQKNNEYEQAAREAIANQQIALATRGANLNEEQFRSNQSFQTMEAERQKAQDALNETFRNRESERQKSQFEANLAFQGKVHEDELANQESLAEERHRTYLEGQYDDPSKVEMLMEVWRFNRKHSQHPDMKNPNMDYRADTNKFEPTVSTKAADGTPHLLIQDNQQMPAPPDVAVQPGAAQNILGMMATPQGVPSGGQQQQRPMIGAVPPVPGVTPQAPQTPVLGMGQPAPVMQEPPKTLQDAIRERLMNSPSDARKREIAQHDIDLKTKTTQQKLLNQQTFQTINDYGLDRQQKKNLAKQSDQAVTLGGQAIKKGQNELNSQVAEIGLRLKFSQAQIDQVNANVAMTNEQTYRLKNGLLTGPEQAALSDRFAARDTAAMQMAFRARSIYTKAAEAQRTIDSTVANIQRALGQFGPNDEPTKTVYMLGLGDKTKPFYEDTLRTTMESQLAKAAITAAAKADMKKVEDKYKAVHKLYNDFDAALMRSGNLFRGGPR